MNDIYLLAKIVCPDCGGRGYVYYGRCSLCGIATNEYNPDSTQSCGHSWSYYTEEKLCESCSGSGWSNISIHIDRIKQLLCSDETKQLISDNVCQLSLF